MVMFDDLPNEMPPSSGSSQNMPPAIVSFLALIRAA